MTPLMVVAQPMMARGVDFSPKQRAAMTKAMGALVAKRMAFRRGPSRRRAMKRKQSPMAIPMSPVRARMVAAWRFRVARLWVVV